MKYYACLFDYREIILLLILMLIPVYSQEQSINTESFQYLSPLPNSKLNSAETNIIVRFGKAFDNSVINKSSLLTVTGSKSGVHSGKIILTENGRTLIYNPDWKFEKGERVTVELRKNFKTINGDTIPSLFYSFEITNSDINKHLTSESYLKKLFPDLDYGEINNSTYVYNIPQQNKFKRDTLPEDFPEIFIDSTNNPSEGFIFFSPFLGAGLVPSYLIIADNYGTPVYYKKITGEIAVDFKKQENGFLTYYNNNKFYVMDSSYTIIDSLYTQNGYPTDLHECIIMDNDHTLLMSYDDQVVRMDTIVPGG
ncbi:MAG TPA: Ig-like domain-containing protein, partial [Ignavibacteriaceae bacterium]